MEGQSRSGERRTRTRERERLLLAAYHGLGDGRSLPQLEDLTRQLGIPVSLSTLKRYSTTYHWQERLRELEAEAATVHRQQQLRQSVSIADRHAQVGRALQAAGGAGLQRLLGDRQRIENLSPSDIVRLLQSGLNAEAHSVADAREHKDMALALANILTEELVAAFLDINKDPDPAQRARAFAEALDDLIDRFLTFKEDS